VALSVRPDGQPSAAPLDADARLRRLNPAIVFGGCALALGVLYWTQAVLIPIALAVLLSFLLSPLVRGFERARFGRVGSVVVVVVLAFGILGGVGFGLFTQVTRLADELPGYRSNIRAKVVDFQGATHGGLIDKFRRAVDDAFGAIDRGNAQRAAQRGLQAQAGAEPVPVVMQAPSVLWQIPDLLEGMASAGLVLVLVIFMLLERRQLRDRLLRLIGYGRLAVTTRALDEAAARISRYLVAQSLLNAGYGVTIGIGLYFLGVPYALLWGFLAAILRFIPYVGPFLAAGLPLVLSLAAFAGWWVPFMVVGLFALCELSVNMIIEPLVYGQSVGISQVALLAAIAFWTWLWGPLGLVLATPLTVCLVVLSKNVPELQFIFVLLADEEVLEPDVRLYLRLLAGDDDEAREVVAEHQKANAACDPFDDLLVPVLVRSSIDRANLRLSADEEHRLLKSARRLLAAMAKADEVPREQDDASVRADAGAPLVLGCPAVGDGDALALQILAHDMARSGIRVETLWSNLRSLELLATVEEMRPRVVCITALPPRGAASARYLSRRLRRQFPDLTIVVLAFAASGEEASPEPALTSAGANIVAVSIRAARAALLEIAAPVVEPEQLAV